MSGCSSSWWLRSARLSSMPVLPPMVTTVSLHSDLGRPTCCKTLLSGNREGTCWGVIQSEPELKSTGVSGLQLLQVLPQNYVLFSLKWKGEHSL